MTAKNLILNFKFDRWLFYFSVHGDQQRTIHLDEWRGYQNLPRHVPACMLHNTVNHTYNFVDPNAGAHTQISKSGKVSEKVFKSIVFSVTTDFLLTVWKI